MHHSLFDSDLTAFQQSVRKWIQNEISPHHEEWEKAGIAPKELYKKAGDQGFLLTNQNEKYGGLGLDFRYSALMMEELCYAGATGISFYLHSDIIAPYIEHFGSEEQKLKWLPKMASGEKVSALAMTEPGAGSDVAAFKTTARLEGDKFILNGQKTFISNGINADLIIVAAKSSFDSTLAPHKQMSLFIVESSAPGFKRGRKLDKLGLRAQDTAEMFFDNCVIPKENLLGEINKGFYYLMQSLAAERLCVAIWSVALARNCLKQTLQYTKDRKAFGHNISHFQVNRHKLADMWTEIEVGEAYCDRLIVQMDKKIDLTVEASMAKTWCSEMLGRVVDQCVQLYGGYGFMLEYPITRFYADARIQRIYAGTNEIMREIIAKKLIQD